MQPAPSFRGCDDLGRDVGTHEEFWVKVKRGAKTPEGKPLWYARGIEYWDDVDASVDGVLGGFAHVSAPDARDNAKLLKDAQGGERFTRRRRAHGGVGLRRGYRTGDEHVFDRTFRRSGFGGAVRALLERGQGGRGGERGRREGRTSSGGIFRATVGDVHAGVWSL